MRGSRLQAPGFRLEILFTVRETRRNGVAAKGQAVDL